MKVTAIAVAVQALQGCVSPRAVKGRAAPWRGREVPLSCATAGLVACVLSTGCSTADPQPGLYAEVPYFPSCVAKEEGGYHERELLRASWNSAGYPESAIVEADCVQVEP